MARVRSPIDLLHDAAHAGADAAIEQLSNEFPKITVTESSVKVSVYERIDETILHKYDDEMSKYFKSEADSLKKTLAYYYGVEISDLTKEFLASKRKDAEARYDGHLRSLEEKRGIKFERDTPRFRKEVRRKFDAMINAAPK